MSELNKIVLNYTSGNISYYDALLEIINKTNKLNIVFADDAIQLLNNEYKKIINKA